MPKSEAKWDAGFEVFRSAHPGASFAEYYVAGALAKIRDGRELASLGPILRKAKDGTPATFDAAGARDFRQFAAIASLRAQHHVIDYGCGTLRLGIHAIQFLDRGHYLGLDVTLDFIDIGKELIGEALREAKQPRFEAIDEASTSRGVEMGADLIFSNAVAYHVHPEEMELYLGNLRRLASKPGSVLVFDAKMAETPLRYHKSGWAWPLSFYVERLKPLRYVAMHAAGPITDDRAQAGGMTGGILEFRMP